jgi:hypothetical protein
VCRQVWEVFVDEVLRVVISLSVGPVRGSVAEGDIRFVRRILLAALSCHRYLLAIAGQSDS